MNVSSAASLIPAAGQSDVGTAAALKALKLANEQQQSVLSLIDAAVESADQIRSEEPGKGEHVDVSA